MKLSERLEQDGRHSPWCDMPPPQRNQERPIAACTCYLSAAIEQAREMESQLMNLQAAISPSRVGVKGNEYFIAVVERMKNMELAVRPMESSEADTCTRASGHAGPCNGFPRSICRAALTGPTGGTE